MVCARVLREWQRPATPSRHLSSIYRPATKDSLLLFGAATWAGQSLVWPWRAMEKKRTGSLIKRETDRTEQNITEKWKKRRRRRRPFVLTIRRGSPSPRAASGSARSRTCPAAVAARCTSSLSLVRGFSSSPPSGTASGSSLPALLCTAMDEDRSGGRGPTYTRKRTPFRRQCRAPPARAFQKSPLVASQITCDKNRMRVKL